MAAFPGSGSVAWVWLPGFVPLWMSASPSSKSGARTPRSATSVHVWFTLLGSPFLLEGAASIFGPQSGRREQMAVYGTEFCYHSSLSRAGARHQNRRRHRRHNCRRQRLWRTIVIITIVVAIAIAIMISVPLSSYSPASSQLQHHHHHQSATAQRTLIKNVV